MPVLPRPYEQARDIPRPDLRVVQADTSAMPRAVMNLGGAVQNVSESIDRVNIEDEKQQLFEARRQLDSWERDAIFSAEKGAINKTGRDAFGIAQPLAESFDQTAAKVGEGFSSPRLQKAYGEMLAARKAQVLDWAAKHETQQRKVFNEREYQADMGAFSDRAALYADDPAKVATEVAMAKDRTIGHYRSLGASEAQIQQAIKEGVGKIHAQALGAMIDTENIEGAKKYVAQYGAEMDERTRAIAGKAIKQIETTNQAQTYADEAFAKGMNLSDALAGAREKFSGDMEKHAVSEVKMRWQEKEAIEADRQKELVDQAWQQITTRGRVSAGLMAQLPGKEIAQIQNYQRARAREARADAREARADAREKQEAAGFQRYMELRKTAMENPTAFAGMDLSREFGSVGKTQLEQLMDIQGQLKKPGAAAESVVSFNQRIDSAVDQLGIGKDDKKKGQLTSFIHERLRAYEADGKKATPKEQDEIIRQATFEAVTKDGMLWDTKKRVFEMSPEDIAGAIKNIPPDTRALIIDALRKTGRPITDAAIFDLYTSVK